MNTSPFRRLLLALADKIMATSRDTYMRKVIHPRVDRIWDMRIRLAQMQATTLEGFRAKSSIVRRYCDCDDGYATPEDSAAVAWSLANDLLGLPCVWKDEGENAA